MLKEPVYKGTALHRYAIAAGGFPQEFALMLDIGGHSYVTKDPTGKRSRDLRELRKLWDVSPFSDAGGRRRLTLNLLAKDYEPTRMPDVNGDCTALPFQDRAIPLVVSVDMLEHVPPGKRETAVRELVRVAGSRGVLVFPFYSERAAAHEREIIQRMRSIGVKPPPAIVEHDSYGLPRTAVVEATLDHLGIPYTKTYHAIFPVLERFAETQVAINTVAHLDRNGLHSVILDMTYLVSHLLCDTDHIAGPENARRVRYVIATDGGRPEVRQPEEIDITRKITKAYLAQVDTDERFRDVTVDLFTEILTEAQRYYRSVRCDPGDARVIQAS